MQAAKNSLIDKIILVCCSLNLECLIKWNLRSPPQSKSMTIYKFYRSWNAMTALMRNSCFKHFSNWSSFMTDYTLFFIKILVNYIYWLLCFWHFFHCIQFSCFFHFYFPNLTLFSLITLPKPPRPITVTRFNFFNATCAAVLITRYNYEETVLLCL